MKKLLIIALAITLVLTLAAGCGNNNSDAKDAKESPDAVQIDPSDASLKEFGEMAAKQGGASLEGIRLDNGIDGMTDSGGMMAKAQTAPVNEDWEVATASESE